MPPPDKATVRKSWIAALLLIAVLGVGQYFWPEHGAVCTQDSGRSTEQLLALRPDGQIDVPNDVSVEHGHLRARFPIGTVWYSYPTTKSKIRVTTTSEHVGSATCRIRDSVGEWWIVEVGGKGRPTGYTPLANLKWGPIL